VATRKNNNLYLRYQRACQAALRNRCIAWFEEGDTCIVNMNNDKVYHTIPADLLDAMINVPYRWSIHIVIAGKSNKLFTKGSVIQTLSKYYASDLTNLVGQEFEKLEKNFNRTHYHRKGYVAIPRIEDLSEAQVETILDRIGIWNNEN